MEKKGRLFRSMTYLMEAQFDQTVVQRSIALFSSDGFIKTLDVILSSDQHLNGVESKSAVLKIITKVAEWLILNNIPCSNRDQYLMNVWRELNLYGCNPMVLKFNWTEIIRLLSHSIFGYPKVIEQHESVCTCKRVLIDWNGAALLLTSFDSISNG